MSQPWLAQRPPRVVAQGGQTQYFKLEQAELEHLLGSVFIPDSLFGTE